MKSTFAVAVLTALFACGDKRADKPTTKDDASVGPTVAPIALPPLGLDSIRRANFIYGDGMKDFDKAQSALKAREWATLRKHAESALAKDPHHLDAHWAAGVALAQTGEHAAAVDHLVTALAGDLFRYDDKLASDKDLEAFRATPHGTAVGEVAQKIRGEYTKRIARGVLLIARRSTFKWPREGVKSATSRGEVYAFDRETKRYIRLTHTDHQAAAFVRAPSGNELAVFGFDRIDKPKGDDATPMIERGWIEIIDFKEWKRVGKRVTFGPAREVHVGYGAGDQLLVATAPASGRWGIGELAIASVDKTASKLTKVKADLPVPRFAFSLEEGRVVRAAEGIKAAWTGDPPRTASLGVEGGATIAVPESGAASQASVALAPDKARIAFATAVDPCAADTAPSLYVADAKTGALDHLLTAKSRFVTRWLDATTLAYEDGEGAIRIWDATTGREAIKLENKAGIALEVLSLAPAPLCKGAPPTADVGTGSADEPPLPPEEDAPGDGPVTKPD